MINVLEPMDFWQLFVNDISGSQVVFIFLSLFFIGVVLSRFRVSNILTVIFLIVYGLLLSFFFKIMLILTIWGMGALIAIFLYRMINPRT